MATTFLIRQVAPHAYNLVLNCDANPRGHTQWFFFRVKNMVIGANLRPDVNIFKICIYYYYYYYYRM